jgi:hypothetical protein
VAAQLARALWGAQRAWIYRAGADDERAALDYFLRHTDNQYSAVDSLSIVVMEKLAIREVLGAESDFARRFIVRPGHALRRRISRRTPSQLSDPSASFRAEPRKRACSRRMRQGP